MATSINGVGDSSPSRMASLKAQFDNYQDNVRDGYLFVESLVRQMDELFSKSQTHDGEVKNYMHKIRDLERENMMLKERVKKDDQAMNNSTFAAVILDGEFMLFSRDLITRGFEGGQEAARLLSEYSRNALQLPVKLIIHVFANVTALANVLVKYTIISKPDTFYDFADGFNSFAELVTYSNVGQAKGMTELKVMGLTKMYASMPQCENVILGENHEEHFNQLLSKLETENITPSKITLLHPSAIYDSRSLTGQYPSLSKHLDFGDLFMSSARKIETGKQYAQVVATIPDTIPSPLTPIRPTSRKSSTTTALKLPEPELNVWLSVKNLSPRACNMFYLNPLKCSKPDCEYSHDHNLTAAQLGALRYNCKKQLCRAYQHSEMCPYGNDCIYGHECPENVGGKCLAGKKCKLMHPGASSP